MTVASSTKKANQEAFLKYKPPINSKAKLASGKATLVITWLPRVRSIKNAIEVAITSVFDVNSDLFMA